MTPSKPADLRAHASATLKKGHVTTSIKDKLLSVEEAAAYIGLKPATVRNWLWRRSIPSYRIKRSVRIKQSDLDRILDDGFVPADPALIIN